MDLTLLSKSVQKENFDSLSSYHHIVSFESKLQNLLSILDMPKEYKVAERFNKIESALDNTFRLELLYHLHLKNSNAVHLQDDSEYHSPELLLHLWCLLECTDSLDYIANYLELSAEEVKELFRELHNTFSIDSLASRIRAYYEQNKQQREVFDYHKRVELLGSEPSTAPQDTAEDRKQRLRRRYGHLATMLDATRHPF